MMMTGITALRPPDEQIAANVARVRAEIAAACARCGRHPNEVTLIGVTKSADRHAVNALIAAGVHDLGESRVQDALVKFGLRGDAPPLPSDVRLHMIGNLQTNKARDVVRHFAVVHSLNRIALAEALQGVAAQAGGKVSVLIEVNLSDEDAKQGASEGDVIPLIRDIQMRCANVSIDGLMTIAPNNAGEVAARATFRALRELRERMRDCFPDISLPVLSMGMSNDFPIAVEEGATHIRVGRALFTGTAR